jgi:glutamate-5-semialdehyde dehydrogenase
MTTATAAKAARAASILLAGIDTATKNRALEAISTAIENRQSDIIAANKLDLERAEKESLAAPLLKRLRFDDKKIAEVREGLSGLIQLPDPVGVTLRATSLDQGLDLYQVSCPIGVIGVVFESRPDALVQISSLCLKSGNAALLKGGAEAAETNRMLTDIILEATRASGIPEGWLSLFETRADVAKMLELDHDIDLIIPRGSNAFVRHIMENTHIPVLGHADGICHVYVDKEADLAMAEGIVVDSKCQYVAVCNAAETLLVHRAIAEKFLPMIQKALEDKGVRLLGCEKTRQFIGVAPAMDTDWETEYLDLMLSIKVVDGLDAAIEHINRYGSGHTDAIVTENRQRGEKFMDYVDSADVFLNCSTRFSDGFRFGLGAEVGISTNKIHARGPVGLEGLMIYKWRMIGSGQVVSDYSGVGAKKFLHKPLSRKYPKFGS